MNEKGINILLSELKQGHLSRREFLSNAIALIGSASAYNLLFASKTTASTGNPGEAIPPIVTTFPNDPVWIEYWRSERRFFEELGLELELRPVEFGTAVDMFYSQKDYGHLMSISWAGREERIDPHFFLYEMLHSSRIEGGGLNSSQYRNLEYDGIAEEQSMEIDEEKRKELIFKLQEIIYHDRPQYILIFQDIIHAYNSRRWTNVVPRLGAGIASASSAWTYLNIEPLTNEKELKVAWMNDPVTLNPFTHRGTIEHMAMLRFIYDTFVKLSPTLEVVPWAAKSWEWIDNKTLKLVIRDDMYFHDGVPVTAEDVKFTFDYAKKWEFSVWDQVTDHIKSVDLIDKYTVRIHLPAPYPLFLQNVLTFAFIAPKHIWEKIPESVDAARPDYWEPFQMGIGSGFFKYDHWDRGDAVYLLANKDHWHAPKAHGVTFLTIPSLDGMLGRMEVGELDLINAYLSPVEGRRLENLDHVSIASTANHGFYMSNPDTSKKPFSDRSFRIAIDHIMNRRMMLNDIFAGAGTQPHDGSPINPEHEWFNPAVAYVDFNINKAREILLEAGYSWDDRGRLRYPS